MLTIQPQYLTLSKLLDGRLFKIPEYQRAYSWTSHQRNDLFGDIEKTHAKGRKEGHFMAAVVCLHRSEQILGTDEFHVLEVVDGQQRLTTLIMLLKAIQLALDKTNKEEKKVRRELAELLVKAEGDELLLLRTNHDSSLHFVNFLRSGKISSPDKAETIAEQEMLKAIESCIEFVVRWQNDHGTLPDLVALLKNRLFFLLHEIDDEKSVYTVFEVLNSRGLEVSWLDRLKSILMGAAFELKNSNQKGVIAELHNTWRDIYTVIGLRQGLSTEALRFAATLYSNDAPSRPLGEKEAVDALRTEATNARSIREVASRLLHVTRACDEVISNVRTNAVTRIAQARLLATAIRLRDDIDEKDRVALLVKWEKVSFRIYGMLGNDARTRVGDYVRLAWEVINEKPSVKRIGSALTEIGRDFPIEDAVDGLRGSNCYEGWETELRYVMFRYEEYLAQQQNNNFRNEQWEKVWMVSPSDSIEHIWPKSKAAAKHKHRLGNLVILPPKLNSKLQAKSPKLKANAYRKTGLLIAGEVADIIELEGRWSAKMIDDRENALLKWAMAEWGD